MTVENCGQRGVILKPYKNILENISVDEVTPYERNARKNDAAVKEVAKSIQRTGYRTPIIVDENKVILCGHTRLKAIKSLKWQTIPFVVQYLDLTEEQKQEYRIRDNKTGEIAEWDFDILEADFSMEELVDLGFNRGTYENQEIDTNAFIDEMTLKIKLTATEYEQAKKFLDKIDTDTSKAFMELIQRA